VTGETETELQSARRGANPSACPELKRLVRLAGAQCSSRLRDDTPARRILALSARCFSGGLETQTALSPLASAPARARTRRRPRTAPVGPRYTRGRAGGVCLSLLPAERERSVARRRTHRRTRSEIGPAPHLTPDGQTAPRAGARRARARAHAHDAQEEERPHRTSPYTFPFGAMQTWRYTRSVGVLGTVTSESSAAQD
jgi:hypothetical protein